ncbi:MAG TPA: hypothetical protein VLZ83_17050 [Edaphocola sp.]|nr:hypothetical protein [Edaphocola sp.]
MSDKKQHEILGYLTEPILEHYGTDSTIVARSFDEIGKQFNLNKRQVWEQASELLLNKEIVFYNVNFKGFMGTDKGIVSFTTKKYLSRKRNNNRESIKFYLGVFIPVVSLLIALFTVLNKIDNIDMKSKNSIEKLEKKINELEKKAVNN